MAKQAVVVIHGMGEQLPMETLRSFVDTAWASDASLVDRGKPDPNSGGGRVKNAYWSKPDRRSRSFELRVIATESGKNRKRTDFYEFYWAHLMVDTTWEQLRAWVFELMLRNPFTKVPRAVLPLWLLLWLIGIVAALGAAYALRPGAENATWLGAIAAALFSAALGWFVSGFLVRYFGDVARYVRPKPANVARRQEIRENGVRLLESLMGLREDGSVDPRREYDRIVVVAHSLGTIIAYDILSHAFARINTLSKQSADKPAAQDARVALEAMIRDALAGRVPWDLDAFQTAQAAAAKELAAAGNPWIVSDFVTLGSPLTHAEFLIARDRAHLTEAKAQRILPCCPPTLEYDGQTKLRHFTYRPWSVEKIGKDNDPAAPRLPHHAALFAYTRWINLYSPYRFVAWGDVISGPVGGAFGLEDGTTLRGIRDIAVLPELDANERPVAGARRPFFTHTKYWREQAATDGIAAHHIRALRAAMRLGE